MDHKSVLGKLEATVKSAQEQDKQQAYENLLASYPLLFGYWLQYLRAYFPKDTAKWKEALKACPALDLCLAFLKFDLKAEDLEFCVEQVGYYFQAAPVWDALLKVDPSQLQRVLRVPLYDYAKYFGQAREQGVDVSIVQPEMTANINGRWPYESKIKRPYFHVLPLDQSEIDNWNSYLDFQEARDSEPETTAALYKRCLVATALYPEFWARWLRWAAQHTADQLDHIFTEASRYHKGPERVHLANLYSAQLELQGQLEKARAVLVDKSAIADFDERNPRPQLSLEEARAKWEAKQLDKHRYLEVLRRERQLEEFFKLDVVVNGAPDAAKLVE